VIVVVAIIVVRVVFVLAIAALLAVAFLIVVRLRAATRRVGCAGTGILVCVRAVVCLLRVRRRLHLCRGCHA
jgi:hypothetical protein